MLNKKADEKCYFIRTTAEGSDALGVAYNAADQATGTRTLASRGLSTLIVASSTVVYVSGAGVS